MAPKYRQIPTKTPESFDFNDIPSDFGRMFWLMLPIALDSEGRGIDNIQWLRSKLFPIREDDVTEQICSTMDWLATKGMIVRYQVDGRKYFYSLNFKTYQTGTDKEAASFLPAPPSLDNLTPDLLRTNSGVTPDLVRVNTIQCNADAEAEASETPKNLPLTTIPSDPADRVWRKIKPGSLTIPPSLRESVMPIIDEALRRNKLDEDITAAEGKKYFDAYCKTRSKKGNFYSPHGTGWIDWWAQGSIPSNGNGSEHKYSEVHQ